MQHLLSKFWVIFKNLRTKIVLFSLRTQKQNTNNDYNEYTTSNFK